MSKSPDAAFTLMADRITHNAGAEFGGAAVIFPPGQGKPIELLMLGPGDAAQFLSTVMTRIQLLMKESDEEQRRLQGFGMR